MPPRVGTTLQTYIKALLDMLEYRRDLPAYLDVPRAYRSQIVKILKEWQHQAGAEFPARRMRSDMITQRRSRQGMNPPTRNEWKIERKFYEPPWLRRKTGILHMPSPFNQIYEETVHTAYQSFVADPSQQMRAASNHVDANWAPNVTMVDLEWLRHRPPCEGVDIDLGEDPYGFGDRILGLGILLETGVDFMKDINAWFMVISACLSQMKPFIKIEACLGDVTAVLEQIRHGVVGHREGVDHTPDAEESSGTYPQLYDRIHLSNIPDYIGGPLSSVLYATPMTHPGDASYVTSTCLRNPPRFPSVAVYNNEYLALDTPADLAMTFRVRISPPRSAGHDDFPMPLPDFMPMNDYHYWHHLPGSLELSKVMPRDRMETWLYRLFFKLAIPVHKNEIWSHTLISSPLNLTAYLRVISHLHDVGYPAHWLADVVGSLLSGKIKTSARPPRSEPLTIRETRAERPMIEQSVAPFVAEFQTLVSMWQFALPFGLTSSAVPDVGTILHYRVDFKDVQEYAGDTAVFVLAFCETRLVPPQPWLRQYLTNDEKSDSSPQAKKVREEGLHIVSTWKWTKTTRTATFWLRSDVMERMRQGAWVIGIWRTDNWMHQALPEIIDEVKETGETWL
ncbi:hypothetical protein LTR56_011314 [Elasticomyces elasticus]|nr:hypothetical protein LTR56_011314 [Elasticomyces elasticus]KAK3668386.1 hypothetical protein LTR22_000678 [Elasticomyces elasticus]KAK5758664.1 hypothetical protein LTS12_011210 [Elasticomyces elasticus]